MRIEIHENLPESARSTSALNQSTFLELSITAPGWIRADNLEAIVFLLGARLKDEIVGYDFAKGNFSR